MIDFIIYFIQSIILTIAVVIALKKISNVNAIIKTKQKITLTLLAISTSLIHLQVAFNIKLAYLIIMYLIINRIILKLSIKESIINTLIIIIYLLAGDLLFVLLIIIIIDINIPLNIDILSNVQAILISLFLVKIVHIKKVDKVIKNFKKSVLNKSFGKSLTLFIIIEIIIYIILSIATYKFIINKSYEINIIVLFVFCTILVIIFQIILSRVLIINNQRETTAILNKYYIERIEDDKIYKHNIKNKILSLKAESNKTTKILIDEILEIEDNKMNNMIQFSNIPDSFLPIIYDKLNNNSNLKIEIINNIKSKYKLKYATNIKLNEALAICLDNAIDESKFGDSFLIIVFEESDSEIIIKLKNNFKSHIDIDKISDIKYTTKKTGNGIGLYSLKKIKGINSKFCIINDIFNIKICTKK